MISCTAGKKLDFISGLFQIIFIISAWIGTLAGSDAFTSNEAEGRVSRGSKRQ